MVNALLARDRPNFFLATGFVVLASLGALQIFAAHVRHPILLTLVYGAMLAGVCFQLLFCPLPLFLQGMIANPWAWVIVLCAMMAVDMRHYAHAMRSPDPMTTGLAITEPGNAMLHGHDPYGVELPHGAPISPGPGWIVLLLPLSASHTIALLDGLVLLIAALAIRRPDRIAGGLLIVLMLLQPMFLSEAANAQDLFVISLMLAMLCWILGTSELTTPPILSMGVFSGFVATSRIPVILFFAVIAAGIWKRSRQAAVLYGASTLAVCLALHAGFELLAQRSGDIYQPAHIFGRASGGGLGWPVVASILLLCAATAAMRLLTAHPASWMLACWLTMTALFAPIGLRELVAAHFNWRWEGDNYIVFPLPLLAAAIAVRAGRQTDAPWAESRPGPEVAERDVQIPVAPKATAQASFRFSIR